MRFDFIFNVDNSTADTLGIVGGDCTAVLRNFNGVSLKSGSFAFDDCHGIALSIDSVDLGEDLEVIEDGSEESLAVGEFGFDVDSGYINFAVTCLLSIKGIRLLFMHRGAELVYKFERWLMVEEIVVFSNLFHGEFTFQD